MQKIKFCFIIILTLAIFSGNSFPQDLSKKIDIEGNWIGTLNVSTVQLRIVFHIQKSGEEYSATLDSPDQGAKDIPTSKVSFDGKRLEIDVPVIKGTYAGRYYSDSSFFNGMWSQGGRSLPLNLVKTNQNFEIIRPQEPKKPYPYNEEEVTFENKKAGDELSGTFTYPKVGKKFTTVLLIPGSGPHNRNEEILGHKPFLVISDYLSRHGIAVLRYDDRGVGKSTGYYPGATSKDLASDAAAAVNYLKTRKDVEKIGLLGHSEGGIIAPMVENQNKNVSFIILMAAPGIPCDQILLQQSYLIGKGSGENDSTLEITKKLNEKIYNIIKENSDSSQAAYKLEKVASDFYENSSPQFKQALGTKENFLSQLKPVLSPWFRYFIKYDPRPALEKVKCPVLAIDGSKDVQVPPKEDIAAIKKALVDGGNKKIKIVEFDGLNHLFQTAKSGLPSEYNKISETISPKVLELITNWILEK